MKIVLSGVVLGSALMLSSTISANQNAAQVTNVTPVYMEVTREVKVIEEVTVCREREVNKRERGSFGSAGGLLGAAIGIAVGSQMGTGRERDLAMGTGAVLGGIVGGQLIGDPYTETVEECRQVDRAVTRPETRIERKHYRVDVQLNGETYTVFRQNEPVVGDYIDISVSVH